MIFTGKKVLVKILELRRMVQEYLIGELGRITKINNQEKNLEVEFDDDKKAWYAFSELDELELAYSITIHKAQRE